MQVRILGSGAADGWPNPWCACGSCLAAREQQVLRGQTAVLLDGRVLIDAGPDALRAAARQGVSLADVDLVLVTHRHEDHHHAMGWQWRSWAAGTAPVTLLAPPSVLAAAKADQQVSKVNALPGGRHELGGYVIRVLDAEHPEDSVLYDVTGPDGARLLYATDTGVLPESTVEQARDRAFDLVLLECAGTPIPSHLTLKEWPDQVRRLREVGALTEATRLLAIHVGHDNPPPHELDRVLADHGARAARDGDVLDTARGRRVLVLGGQSSGKSAYAEGLLHGDVTYVATAADRPGDAEWADRVAVHRARRPQPWQTVETHDLASVLSTATGQLLIDDLGLWLTQVLDGHWESPTAREVFDKELDAVLTAWTTTRADVVLVAPEVGSGVIASTVSGRLFSDQLGRATTALANRSDEVVQVVAGQPRRLR
ncbi:MAG: putative adenosyl cobinamide kinase/adenosyl cobinamide phosphate guanylyltransferase [Frankiales bacterium]|nr:putative adenosyl cobinamide kinase/adenosyl cobinamide phosphate guanylyltransferase [Frankiales bacterium]